MRANTGSSMSLVVISLARSGWRCLSACINGQQAYWRDGVQRERRFTLLQMDEFERQKKMQNRIMPKHSPGITVIVILLTIQAILGLFFSLPLLAGLLAPGRPVIVSGAAIFAGPEKLIQVERFAQGNQAAPLDFVYMLVHGSA